MNKYCIHCMSMIGENDMFCPQCGNSQNIDIPGHLLRPGTLLNNRYVVGKMLGEGGFGITYIGRDTNLDRLVAIKEYYPTGIVNRSNTISAQVVSNTQEKENYEQGCEKFLREARMLAKFSNEDGIVGVVDFFRENGTAYIIMEYLSGYTLQDYLNEKGRLSVEETMLILTPIVTSLQKIHQQGLIHRDISPSNIMLANGKIKLIDFGAARNVSPNGNKSLSLMLKPGYAPEEQYRSKGVQGSWTDVYALCATIYRCITGIVPEEANDRTYSDELKAPSALGVQINPYFENALMKGLAVYSNDRYQTIQELLDGLNGISAIKYEDKPTTSVPQRHNDPSSNDSVAGKREDDKSTEWIDEHRVFPASQPLPKPPQRENERAVSVDNPHSGSQNKAESVPSPTAAEKNVKKRPSIPLMIGLSAVVVLLTVGVILFASGVFNKKPADDNQKHSIDNQLVSQKEESTKEESPKEESPTESSENSTVPVSVNVNFETNGAAPIVSTFVSFGGTYGDLPVPEKEGYTFKGWSFSDVNQYSTQFLHNTNIYFRVPEAWGTSDDIYCHLWNNQAEDSLYPWQSEQQKCKQVNGNVYKYTIPAGANVDSVLFSSSDGYQTYDVAIATICENDLFYCIGQVPGAKSLFEGAWSIHKELGPIPSTVFENVYLTQEITDLDKIVINDYHYVYADTKVVCPEDHTLYAVWKKDSESTSSSVSDVSEEVHEMDVPQELGNNIFDYNFAINSKVYTIPFKLSDLLSDGDFSLEYDEAYNITKGMVISSGDTIYSALSVKYKGNVCNLYIDVTNFYSMNQPIENCYVTNISAYRNDTTMFDLILPKSIHLNTSLKDDIISAYGQPTSYERNAYNDTLTYKKDTKDDKSSIIFTTDSDSNKIYSIRIQNEAKPDNFQDVEIPDTIPDNIKSYVAPSQMSSSFQSGIVSFFGDLYRIPAPLTAFEKNGWKIIDYEQDYIESDNSVYITLERNDIQWTLNVHNRNPDTILLKYGTIEKITSYSYTFSDLGRYSTNFEKMKDIFQIQNSIYPSMDEDVFLEKINGMEYRKETHYDETRYVFPIKKYTPDELNQIHLVDNDLPQSCYDLKNYLQITVMEYEGRRYIEKITLNMIGFSG